MKKMIQKIKKYIKKNPMECVIISFLLLEFVLGFKCGRIYTHNKWEKSLLKRVISWDETANVASFIIKP